MDSLLQRTLPEDVSYDAELFRQAMLRGEPHVGATRFYPDGVVLEFQFHEPPAAALVLPVRVQAPQRIVFLPVPEWVIENIWQGDIDGSFHFQEEAERLVANLKTELGEEENRKWFEPRAPKRRE